MLATGKSAPNAPTLVHRILWRILPLVFLSLIAIASLNYVVARHRISTYIAAEIHTLADPVASTVQAFMEQRQQDLLTLAETPLIIDYFKNVDYNLEQEAQMYGQEIQEYFARFAQRTRVYSLIAYIDEHDQLVAGAEGGEPLSIDERSVLDLGDWARVTDPFMSIHESNGSRHIVLTRRIQDDHDRYRGTLVLVCDLDQLNQLLRSTHVGNEGAVYLIDMEGQVVLGDSPAEQLQLKTRSRIAGTPWRVVVEADSDEFLQPLVTLRNLTILLSLVVGLLMTLTLTGSIRRATRPIDEMERGTRRLAQGDLDYRFLAPRVRELQPLATAFNDMAATLQARNSELEARIRQLTALRTVEEAVTQQLDEDGMLRSWLRAVADGLCFDRGGLYWVDPEREQIVGRYIHGESNAFTEQAFRRHTVKFGEHNILNWVVDHREPRLVKNPAAITSCDTDCVGAFGSREFVMAPVCGKHRLFGILVADNPQSNRPLTEHHKESLRLFASTAGLALENAMLLTRLTESEARHRIVLENSPIAILGLSREHTITTWNRGAEQIFGFTAAEVIGRPLATLFPQDQHDALRALVAKVAREGAVREHAMVGKSKTEEHLDVTVSWGGSENDFASNHEWAVVIRDVSDAKKLQRQLIFSEKLSVVGQLIAGIAHELNNPLQAVVGYSELLIDGEVNSVDECRQQLHHVYDSALRCRKIIENLLLFVRRGESQRKPLDIGTVVHAALNLLGPRIRNRRPAIKVQQSLPAEPVFVLGHFQQLEQVLVNLIHNACDAIAERQTPGTIGIRVHATCSQVTVEVTDDGVGFTADVIERLFEPFFTTKVEFSGTGLGLTMCRQIVDEHNGQIIAEPRDDGGAVFRVQLARVAAPQCENHGAPTLHKRGSGQNILLIEDEAAVSALFVDLLEADGYNVHAVDSLPHAVAWLSTRSVDLIVADVYLGTDTSFDLFHDWNRYSRRVRPPFLFVTGDMLGNTADQMPDDPSARLLQKPVNLREFRLTVSGLLSRAKNSGNFKNVLHDGGLPKAV